MLTEVSNTARKLELFLGDPRDAASRISFAESVELDERETFPERAVAAVDEWGLQRYYVPESCGGDLRSFEVLPSLVRAVARRDLTVAIAHAKTFLGVAPTWIAGTAEQKRRLGVRTSAGEVVALGLTEETHGSDLFATETVAIETPDGYVLSGGKWLINNATRGDALSVLARTSDKGGPRGFTLFLFTKQEVNGFSHIPKIRTHGIKGADISGIRFDQCALPASARIGAVGTGLELAMKTLQITRTLVPSLSLGALDMGLRQVLAFARGRRLGSGTVAQIPHARRVLTEAFVELLAAEALVRAGARSIEAAPERLSIWSAVIKYLVPSRIDAALRRLAVVLGARHYIRGTPFEKLLRDHDLVALFDGSTVVNLSALAKELPQLARETTRPPRTEELLRERIAALYDFRQALPPFQPDRLELMSRGGDEGPLALALARAEIEQLPAGTVDPEVQRYLLCMTAELGSALQRAATLWLTKERSPGQPPEDFIAAEEHCRLHAAVACTQVWLRNRETFDPFFAGGEWLALALWQLAGASGPAPAASWYERVFLRLDELEAQSLALALEPFALAGQS